MSEDLDFSKDTAEAQAAETSDVRREAELENTEGFDTTAHRRQRIEELRDQAMETAQQMRVSHAQGQIRAPDREPNAEEVYLDSGDRVARTLYREAVEAFVREAFQIINTEEAQRKLNRDYMSGVMIARINSSCPDELLEEYRQNLYPNHREVYQLQAEAHHNGKHDKQDTVEGLREFVNLESPIGIRYDPPAFKNGPQNVIFDSRTYYDICELSWTQIHDVMELTTNALADVGVGFDFESTDEWEI